MQLGGGGGSSGAQTKLLDIMDTLKQCDKFDGFVTLAEGTGLTQILKQDNPMTVFVPSNEALRKIPDEELEVIKNNSTALKEFLMYHVVNGSYFSQDLRDGQQLASILDMKPIQVGVRVDGCSRRLVEANTSPMRRPDIVAKNGVIHILDWYLTVKDNDWCEPVANSRPAGSGSSSGLSSERLQQLASDTSASYAARLPPNHKPAPTQSSGEMITSALQFAAATTTNKGSLASTSSASAGSLTSPQEPNNIIISATPL